MNKFEVVDRPQGRIKGPALSEESRALLETATSGKAIRCSLNGITAHTYRSRFSGIAKERGYRFHSRVDGNTLVAWLEPLEQE